MKHLFILLITLLSSSFARADFSECYSLTVDADFNYASKVCLQHSGHSNGLAISAEIYDESDTLISTIAFSGKPWGGLGGYFVEKTGKDDAFFILVDQFSGQDSWATTLFEIMSLKTNRAQRFPDRSAPSSGGGGGSRCIPGHPSHC